MPSEQRFTTSASRNCAKLLHPRKSIYDCPAICHLAVCEAAKAHLVDLEAFARRRNTKECAWTGVGASNGDTHGGLIFPGDQIFNVHVQVGKCAPQHGGDALEVFAAISSERFIMIDGIWRDQLVGYAQVALVEELLTDTAGDELILFC